MAPHKFHPVDPPDPALQRVEDIPAYARTGRLPWKREADGCPLELRAADGDPQPTKFPLRHTSLLPRRAFEQILAARFRDALADKAVWELARTAPDASAAKLLTRGQAAWLAALALAAAAAFAATPLGAIIAFNIVATAYFLFAIAFRAYLAATSFLMSPPQSPRALDESELPVVTLLLPAHREAKALPSLAVAIRALDYPQRLLDVKLILEEDDAETIAEARRLGLDREFDLILVPACEPRTKPKACNYALQLARGDLVVIYDAEDAPEPDQLRKAAAAFAAGDERLACVQARLNYYNADENWLSRLFALEYALWFDAFLPALEKLRLPIPLGGTSNILRRDILVAVGGWDPHNVTEDADLGLRLSRLGYRTAILDSTTFEEATCRTGGWIRQRSRWMKGYMQTWLVHMRHTREFADAAGWKGVAAAQLFIAGNVFSALINPVLWGVFLFWLATRSDLVADIFPGPLLALNLGALVIGNSFFIYLAAIAPLKRGWIELAPAALLAPAYWALTSLAAYRAMWQLVTRPSFWEKTEHMISAEAESRRAAAIETLKARAA